MTTIFQGPAILGRRNDIKPRQWGPRSSVLSACRAHCDRLGLDHSRIFVRPLWEGAGTSYLLDGRAPGTPVGDIWTMPAGSRPIDGVRFDGSSTYMIIDKATDPLSGFNGTTGATILWHLYAPYNNDGGYLTGTFNDGSTTALQISVNQNHLETNEAGKCYAFTRSEDGKRRALYTSGTADFDTLSGVLGVRIAADDIDIFWAGVEEGTTSYINDAGDNDPFAAFGYNRTLGARNVRGTVDMYAACAVGIEIIATYQLTNAEIALLSNQPYALIQPHTPPLFFDQAAMTGVMVF